MPIVNRRSPYRNWRLDQSFGRSFTINKASPQYNGLVSLWTCFGQNRGVTSLRDEISHFDMTAFNTPTISNSLFGPVVLFDDGANEYLLITSPVLTSAPLSISCWFNTDAATARMTLLALHSTVGPDNDSFSLEARGDVGGDPLRFVVRGGGANTFATTTTGFSTGTWHHGCAVEISPTNHNVYIDGGSKGTNAANRTPAAINRTLIATLTGAGLFFSGMVAEARIYNRALSDGEVWNLFAPSTRWDLYGPTKRAFFMFLPIAPTGVPILTMGGGYSLPVG